MSFDLVLFQGILLLSSLYTNLKPSFCFVFRKTLHIVRLFIQQRHEPNKRRIILHSLTHTLSHGIHLINRIEPVMNIHLPLPSPSSQCLLQTTASSFKDTQDRTIILRGTNLGGSSKLPYGRASHQLYHFFEEGESGDVTYVGRPFLLWDPNLGSGYSDEEEDKDDNSKERKRRWYTSKWEDSADCHLARLKGWGFNLLRYVVTWEALEHDGPYV